MSDYRTDPMKSPRYYEFLREVYLSHSKSYSGNIAEELGVKRSRGSQVLSDLKNAGILKSSKDGRRRIYELNFTGLCLTQIQMFEKSIDLNNCKNYNSKIREFFNEFEKIPKEEGIIISGGTFPKLTEDYIKEYLKKHHRSSIKKMLFFDFMLGYASVRETSCTSLSKESRAILEEVYEQNREVLADPVSTFKSVC